MIVLKSLELFCNIKKNIVSQLSDMLDTLRSSQIIISIFGALLTINLGVHKTNFLEHF